MCHPILWVLTLLLDEYFTLSGSLSYSFVNFHKINVKLILYPKTNQQNWSDFPEYCWTRMFIIKVNVILLGKEGRIQGFYSWEKQVNPLPPKVVFNFIHNKICITGDIGLANWLFFIIIIGKQHVRTLQHFQINHCFTGSKYQETLLETCYCWKSVFECCAEKYNNQTS